jgi:hypothetical protein
MTIHQLVFDFDYQIGTSPSSAAEPNWRVVALARRHGLPVSHARVYAFEMRLPDTEELI